MGRSDGVSAAEQLEQDIRQAADGYRGATFHEDLLRTLMRSNLCIPRSERRACALVMLANGFTQADAALVSGASQGSVCRWAQQARAERLERAKVKAGVA